MQNRALIHFNHAMSNGRVTWPDILDPGEYRKLDPRWKVNYGDMFVCAALLRQVGHRKTDTRVNFGGVVPEGTDVAIIRGSTYLHGDFNFEAAIETLDSIDGSIICVGLGAQCRTRDVTFLDDNEPAKRFAQKLSEKAKSISVRGAFTADVMRRLGADNVRITGCPTLFYNGRVPRVTLPAALETDAVVLGMSTHPGLYNNIFCRNAPQALNCQGELLHYLINRSSALRIFEQGLIYERKAAHPDLNVETRIEGVNLFLARLGLEDIPPEELYPRFVDIHGIDQWVEEAETVDAMIGFRFHGNMVALMQGKPCFFYTYDSRLEEFCEVYGLPSASIEGGVGDPLQRILDHDWGETHKKSLQCFEELKTFYAENGVQPIFASVI